jgi:hypothetical protein
MFRSLWIACLLASMASVASAQVTDKPPAPPKIKVEPRWKGQPAHAARLNGSLVLSADDPDQWIAKTKLTNIRLYLNGRLMPKLSVRWDGKNTLAVDLTRNKDTKDTWSALFGDLSLRHATDVTVHLGTDAGSVGDGGAVAFELMDGLDYFWFFGVVIGSGFVFLGLALKTNMLRDDSPNPATGSRPFSLARMQMAVWFFLNLGAFLLIWLITRDATDAILSQQSVLLMGISSATGLSAVMVDASRAQPQPAYFLDGLGSPPAGPPGPASRGWFRDLFVGATSAPFHRFQIGVWTFVLALVFIGSVVNYLKIPEFDATLLTLMGISGATYVGFKFPEAPKPV